MTSAPTAPSDRHDLSAFFSRQADVEDALDRLLLSGVPRDLIEIAVSPRANKSHVGGQARRLGSQVVPFAMMGALLGLLAGAVLSLEIILVFPGVDPPARELAIAQLLGPNITMIIGLVIGGLVGAFIRRPAAGALSRATEQDGILVVVRSQPTSDDARIKTALESARGRDVRIAPAHQRARRRWF